MTGEMAGDNSGMAASPRHEVRATGADISWRSIALALGLAVCSVFGAVHAQQAAPPELVPTPPMVPTPNELAPRPRVQTDPTDLPAQPRAPTPPRELGKPTEELSLDVKAYDLDPQAPAELKAVLPTLTAPYTGAGRSYEDLANAAAELTRYLQRELGYYLGYAYIPEQEPSAGVVRIAVLEGRLDRVELVWSDGLPVRREVVEGFLARLRPGSVLRVRDIERVVFLVNDLRGLSTRFEIKAGSQPGTATLVVTPSAEARWAGKVDLDANGSRFLGAERVGGLLSYNSPLGRGDALTLNALSSINGGLGFALAGYTLPVGDDGLKVGASVSLVRYKLGEADFPLGVNGDAVSLSAYALYPWVRSRNLNLFVLGSIDGKDYSDRRDIGSSVTRKKVDSLTLGTTGDFRDSLLTGGVSTFELNLAAGQVRYPDGKPAGLKDAADYRKLQLGFTRLQNLVESRLLLYGALRAQQAFSNLDTTEQFRVGGPDGVRAFAPGEGTGDSGQILSLELRLLPPEAWLGRVAREMVFGVFYDVGRVRFRHDPSQEPSTFVNSASFSGAGLTLAWVRANAFGFRFSLAKPLTGTPKADTLVRDPRLYAQISWPF